MLVALRDAPESESVVSLDESSPGATVSLWSELNVEEIEASLEEPSLMTLDGAAPDAVQVPDWMFAAVDTDFAAGSDAGSSPAPDATDEDLLEYRL